MQHTSNLSDSYLLETACRDAAGIETCRAATLHLLDAVSSPWKLWPQIWAEMREAKEEAEDIERLVDPSTVTEADIERLTEADWEELSQLQAQLDEMQQQGLIPSAKQVTPPFVARHYLCCCFYALTAAMLRHATFNVQTGSRRASSPVCSSRVFTSAHRAPLTCARNDCAVGVQQFMCQPGVWL